MTEERMTDDRMTDHVTTINTNNFFNFCENHGMKLKNEDGSLTVQGQAVMETRNCVVAAGAGSGKTTVLSYRFLRMVDQGISPERILTITFTKKATAEMKGRIYELLQKGHEEGLVSDQAMKKFSEVTISTVDSFCSEIVRRDAVHQGVPVDFRIQEKEDFEAMSNAIVDRLLKKHYRDSSVQLLHTYLSVDRIEEIFRDIAYDFLNIAKPFDAEEVSNCLLAVSKELEKAQEKLLAMKRKKKDEQLLALVNLGLEATASQATVNPVLKELYKLIQEYEQELFNSKRSAGVLSFVDVLKLAIKILTENKAVRDFYKAKFDSIMIDEFQDNNDDNRKLLYLLSERLDSHADGRIPTKDELCPNKIFLVGDEKQSIYKFRGADVSVFKKLCTEIGGSPIVLKQNWRSEPAIINFCNSIFPVHIMPRTTTPCEDYEAQYEDLETRPATPKLKSKIVFLHPNYAGLEKPKKNEIEAKIVASFIKEMCSPSSSFLVPDDKEKDADGNPALRPPHYNELGLLLKVSSHQALFEKALTAQGIPYSTTESRSLMKGNLINDFYNALQYCVYPYDKISYAAYLKSPFCSFKDDEIEQILNSPEALAENLAVRLQKVKEELEKLKEVLATGSITRMVDCLWFDMGYRNYMQARELNRPYLDDFDSLYSMAVDYDNNGKSLVAFLDYLRPLLNSTDKLEMKNVVFKEAVEGVQIMTIHKSKGLAFKVVLVADMHSGAGSSGFQTQNVIQNKKLSVRFVPGVYDDKENLYNPLFLTGKEDRDARENAEAKRVLYVAATRAKYHLIFSGADSDCQVKATENPILAYLLKAINALKESDPQALKNYEDCCRAPEDQSRTVQDKPKEYYKSIFDGAVVPKLETSLPRVSVTQAENAYADSATLQTMASTQTTSRKKLPTLACDTLIKEHNFATGFGTLTHKILEDNLKNLQAQISADIEKILSEDNQSFTNQEKEALISCATQLASNFLNSKLYAQIKAMKLMSEKSFLLFNGHSYVEGVLDLLALGEKDSYIIDFKTDSTLAEEDHKFQLDQYVKAVKSLYPEKTIHAYVCYLRDVDNYLTLA